MTIVTIVTLASKVLTTTVVPLLASVQSCRIYNLSKIVLLVYRNRLLYQYPSISSVSVIRTMTRFGTSRGHCVSCLFVDSDSGSRPLDTPRVFIHAAAPSSSHLRDTFSSRTMSRRLCMQMERVPHWRFGIWHSVHSDGSDASSHCVHTSRISSNCNYIVL